MVMIEGTGGPWDCLKCREVRPTIKGPVQAVITTKASEASQLGWFRDVLELS
jgi:hypothetical protein